MVEIVRLRFGFGSGGARCDKGERGMEMMKQADAADEGQRV